MSFDVNSYDNVLIDLVAGTFTSAVTINALLVQSSYVFAKTDTTASSLSSMEVAGAGYARFTGAATFTVAALNDEIQYQVLTPAVSFAAFTTTDWRYIVLYNAASDALYLNLDTGVTNTQAGAGFTLDPGLDPFLRLVAP